MNSYPLLPQGAPSPSRHQELRPRRRPGHRADPVEDQAQPVPEAPVGRGGELLHAILLLHRRPRIVLPLHRCPQTGLLPAFPSTPCCRCQQFPTIGTHQHWRVLLQKTRRLAFILKRPYPFDVQPHSENYTVGVHLQVIIHLTCLLQPLW